MAELRWPGARQPHATTDGWDHRDSELQRRWRGPSARSNWLVPGRVLCGDQPYTLDKPEGRAGLAACDVTTIVCLRTKAEMAGGKNSYTSSMAKLIGNAKFVSFPIVDQSVADDALVCNFIEQLLERIACGEVLYVHCHGGHGRTGTICSLLLGKLYGLSGEDALKWFQRLHNMRLAPIFTAPLFPPQINQVKRLLDNDGDGSAATAAATAAAEVANGADVIEESVAACRAACKNGDAAQCDAAAEQLLAVAPDHPLGLAAQAVGLMQQGEWHCAVKRCEFALAGGAAPPKLVQRLQTMMVQCQQMQTQAIPAPVVPETVAAAAATADAGTMHGGSQRGADESEEMLRKFTQQYRSTHVEATSEIRGGRKRSCWSWWVWPTNYRPGASGMSLTYALSDDEAAVFMRDEYLRGCWVEMMTAVAEQLEAGVTPRKLCGIDAPRVPATCDIMSRATGADDEQVQALCARVAIAMGGESSKRKAGAKPAAGSAPNAPSELERAGGEAKYPSTQHLPFSPGLGDGDTQLSGSACSSFFNGSPQLVLTEKLDGE
jgi:uncharacterized protein (DUF1810 family)